MISPGFFHPRNYRWYDGWMPEKRPEDVFTPRSAQVNNQMYVDRPELQIALASALKGSMHVIIHGESGTGKSWLYKHVLDKGNVETIIANMANAKRFGGLGNEFQNLIDREEQAEKVSYIERKEFGLNAAVATGSLEHQGSYTIGQKEPFEAILQILRRRAGTRPACLVLDNLEYVVSDAKLMEELGTIITLLDDPRYAAYDVKVILVGVPDDVKRYFTKTPNLRTVANRLYELSEVARLTESQAQELIKRGLIHELHYRISLGGMTPHLSQDALSSLDEYDGDGMEDNEALYSQGGIEDADEDMQILAQHISWVTDRIPQQVQEYCLELARKAEVNAGIITIDSLSDADAAWMSSSLSSVYTSVERVMNSRATEVGRRNQVLYALGRCPRENFRTSDIEGILRKEFKGSTQGTKQLNIGAILTELEKADEPIIKRTPKGDAFRFVHPKIRMCLRVMLKNTPYGVQKVEQR